MKYLAVALAFVAGCGGDIAANDAGPDAGASDGPVEGSTATYTACTGSDGTKLYGGSCGQNGCSETEVPPDQLGLCYEPGAKTYGTCDPRFLGPPDQMAVCVPMAVDDSDGGPPSGSYAMTALYAADVGYAIMYAKNGFGSWCHYADRATYDGTSVPAAPASCPTVSGFQLCGGACGDCPQGEYCTGRSPLHPYSVCLTDYSKALEPQTDSCVRGAPLAGGCMGNAQDPASACLTFKVSSADQPFADQNGICTEKSICLAAMAAYPGGAYCTP